MEKTMKLEVLNEQAILEIDRILSAGFDVECRRNRYGISVASVSKQVRYPLKGDNHG